MRGFPTHHLLSDAVPEHPVVLEHANGHTVLVNAQAMALSGIDQATAAPEGGVIVKDLDGRPTGILHETATGLTRGLESYGPERAQYLLEIAQDHLISEGVTSAHDAGRPEGRFERAAGGGRGLGASRCVCTPCLMPPMQGSWKSGLHTVC